MKPLKKNVPVRLLLLMIPVILMLSFFLIQPTNEKTKSIQALRSLPITLYSQPEATKIFKLNDSYRPLSYVKRKTLVNKNGCIFDPATALMWQKSISDKPMTFHQAIQHIKLLNEKQYQGFDNWRLPTIEELSSLLEPEKVDSLYIDPIFHHINGSFWSHDTLAVKTPFGSRTNAAWGVDYRFGYIFWSYLDSKNHFVRGVRTVSQF